ncbi:MAG TPA: hypothetical protein VGD92_13805 [Sphingobacteriaceae bacterium]
MKNKTFTLAFALLTIAYGCSKNEDPDIIPGSAQEELSAASGPARNVVVSTFAGNPFSEMIDAKGTDAGFEVPTNIVIDRNGDFFIADDFHDFLRKMSRTGVVTTLTGFNETDPNAGVDMVFDMFADRHGTLYYTDVEHGRVRKLVGKTKSTLFDTGEGIGSSLSPGIVVDREGAVYFFHQFQLKKIRNGKVSVVAGRPVQGFRDGSGKQARFGHTSGMAIAADGTIYVADAGNRRIRKISCKGEVRTLAGNGARGAADGPARNASFNFPQGIALDRSGNLYVTDGFNHNIRKVSASGMVSTVAGGTTPGFRNGSGKSARFNFPHGIAISAAGDLYVVDENNNRIRKITLGGSGSGLILQ